MNYNKFKTLAYNQIRDKGASMSITRKTRTGFDNSKGTYTETTNTYSCYGIRLNFKKGDRPEGSVVERSLRGMETLEQSKVLFLVSSEGLSITPERSDQVSFDGTSYEIEEVETLSPNGLDILYKVKARK